MHPSFADLEARYPLRDSRLLLKLQLVLSALAFWSPIGGEIEYLPSTAFPFVAFFEVDEVRWLLLPLASLVSLPRLFALPVLLASFPVFM